MNSAATMRLGPVVQKDVDEMRRPLELDLEAAFREMEEDVVKELTRAVKEGATPSETIDRISAMFDPPKRKAK